MSGLSVREVKMLCNGLTSTASLPRGRSQRHAKLTELVAILGTGMPISKENPDARPLLSHYRRILPACTIDRVAEHEGTSPKWTARQRSNLLRNHPTFYEAKFLDSIFSNKESPTAKFDADTWTQLINNNFSFAKEVLLKFLDAGDELPVTPDVLINQIALPLARRLRRRRTATQQHFPFEILELLVRLISRHSDLQRMLDDSLVGIMFHVIKFWEHTRSTRPQVEQHLIELLRLTPETGWQSAKQIVPHLCAVKPAVSYRLFRRMLRHLPAFEFDIDDAMVNENSSLSKIKGPWPARFKIDVDLERRRRKASSSRDWESRAFWARSTLNLAIAAGSLDLYAENLLWARRFNKDVFTVRDLYSERAMKTAEGLDLLSGIEVASHAGKPYFDAAKSVRSANKIIMQLLETASMSLREPSFQAYDWQAVVQLPAAVVQRRLRLVNKFQDARKLTDAEIYEIVWQPTLDFLVEVETLVLHPSHHELYTDGTDGLYPVGDCFEARDKRSHAYKFVDRLAKARDELWQKHRPRRFPSVLTWGEPWPKGLPRVEKVVFGDPKDKESGEAIGRFVDEYSFALKSYVDGGEESSRQEERTRKAWRHAVDSLSGARMTKIEAPRLWKQRFESAGVSLPMDIKAEFPRRTEPSLPKAEDPEKPTEWNPDPSHTEFEELGSKKIPVAILDEMMRCADIGLGDDSAWMTSIWTDAKEVPPMDGPNFWDASQFSQPLPGKSVDAYFASLLLALNAIHGSDSSVLKHPFPSKVDVRYPAIYLDQDFLETVDEAFRRGNEAWVEHIIKSGPPALLVRVVQ
ncbi:hypothetical protein BDP81DRAFT_398720 [Colletotrichum phormii]|uniref:Uncharacterized protein n=1 Tax=Colletotrichum phormii TaxID=359342 RepID=A0AAJ0EA32_9PEZI|nr:uncharacterized protein BDP81DRAFT_398720 [Colletotrichum phormii]KAK1624196.1 hypothetical protein BDP81DRAFT_398720 [Colletotrichum phormii]